MTRGEERLAELLRAVPPASGGVSIEDVARAVRRRRIALGTTASAAVAVVSVVGAVMLFAGPDSGQQRITPVATPTADDIVAVVPWGPPSAAKPAHHDVPPPATASCTAAQLRGHVEPSAVGTAGAGAFRVVVTNISGTPCELTGTAKAEALDASGDPLRVGSPLSGGAAAGVGGHATPEPALGGGASAEVLGSWLWCRSNAPSALRLRVTLPNGDTLTLPPADVPPGTCPGDSQKGYLWMRAWTVLDDLGRPVRDPHQALWASLQLPAQAQVGVSTTFLLVVHNRANGPIPLDPCPTYSIWMGPGSSRAAVGSSRGLNCRAAPAEVPGGKAVAFQVKFAPPRDLDLLGPVKDGEFTVDIATLDTEVSGTLQITGGAVPEDLGTTGLQLFPPPSSYRLGTQADFAAAQARNVLGVRDVQQPVLKLIREPRPGAADRVRQPGAPSPVGLYLVWVVKDAAGDKFAAVSAFDGSILFAGTIR